MSLSHSPKIVLNSLSMYLDAANSRSYSTAISGLYGERYNGYYADDVAWFNTAGKTGQFDYTKNFTNFTSSADYYSWMWYGSFLAPFTGTYTFYTNSDDASMVWLGSNATSGYTLSNALVDNRGLHGAQERSGTISLTAGNIYPMRVMFGEAGGGDFIQLSFSGPGISRTYDGTGYYFSSDLAWKNLITTNSVTTYGNPSFSSLNYGYLNFVSSNNDYYYLGSNIVSWDSGQPFSVSIWFKTNSTGTIFGQQASSPIGSTAGLVPAIYVDSSGYLRTSCFWGGLTTNQSVTPSIVNNNLWHNIVVSYQNGIQKSYLDGALFDTISKTQTYYSPNYHYFLGGGFTSDWPANGGNYFTGSISSFLLYSKALTQSDVLQNFNAIRGRYGI